MRYHQEMNRRHLKRLSILAFGLIVSLVPILAGCASGIASAPEYIDRDALICASGIADSPKYIDNELVITVTAQQLYADYAADEAAADAKYKGNYVFLSQVAVDGDFISETERYIRVGSLLFYPRDRASFDDIGIDYLVDVFGELQGISDGAIIITDSQAEVIWDWCR